MSEQLTDAQIEAERKAIVKATVEKMIAENAVIAHPTVGARLEKDFPGFAYLAREDNFRATIDDSTPEHIRDLSGTPDVPDTSESVSGTFAAAEPVDELGASVEPEPETMNLETLRDAIHQGELARGEIRSQLYAAAAARVTARTILAQCIQTLISGRTKVTPHELAKSFCAAAAAERQTAADTGRGAHPAHAVHHRSKLDQQLAYSTGGDASDRVRSTMRFGHRRGGVSQATASRINQDRALAAAAAAKGGQ